MVRGVNDLFSEVSQPYYASLIGICRSIGQELSHINMQIFDQPYERRYSSDIDALLSVLLNNEINDVVLLRDKRFWVVDYQSVTGLIIWRRVSLIS
ncbi:hypothetical protein [Xenorhabdus szentirmaii]|uniref:Uncharacterized protein n=2 Tax=Xenorhabdus szentirmaii TaxID=290112 RepID=W1J248_9GAMM|nr:hypothetical protein [Xenorhabdus szentirmaii]CDL83911.1 hypothetical protein XSR1_390005 [Xenorhabdus szentirmaii DSM 16338]